MNPVPIGVAGELFIGGDGLAREYLHQPALTDEKFVANPFGKGRLYRTGDVARYLADGSIEFWGRVDHQVKLRGYRIELGEIEAALTELEPVEQAVVALREDALGEKSLVAYVRCSASTAPRLEELRRSLEHSVPSYMIPSQFVVLEQLPLNPNGKVDRDALENIALPKARIDVGSVAPESETERGIASIWCELLSLDAVGVHDDFFDLGGHSLLAMRVQTRLQAVFGVRVPIRALFAAPTIGELARSVDALRGHGDVDVLVEREQGEL
jgi:acyl carrier protein